MDNGLIMITKRIIPCLDCKDGRVVKGVKFQSLLDVGSIQELAIKYQQQQADEIILLDISASLENRFHRIELITNIRRYLNIPLTVGGGIRSIEEIEALLNSGADKVSINTAAVQNPEFIKKAAHRFGSQCIVVAVDAVRIHKEKWNIKSFSGTVGHNIEVVSWCKQLEDLGAGEILLTSYDRDGTNSGYDLNLIRKVSTSCNLPIIASGGAVDAESMKDALVNGADAVLAASIFHFNKYSITEVKMELKQFNILVRL